MKLPSLLALLALTTCTTQQVREQSILHHEEAKLLEIKNSKTSPHQHVARFTALRQKAHAGDTNAQCTLGYHYLHLGLDDQAYAYFVKGAAQEHLGSMTGVAVCLLRGKGVKRDRANAVRILLHTADRGDARAQTELALCYFHGVGGLKKDERKGLGYLRTAVAQGESTAMSYLATKLILDKPSSKQLTYAIKLLHRAAEQRQPLALEMLAYFTQHGVGVPQDAARAIQYFTLAADAGSGNAFYRLAQIYAKGRGIKRNASYIFALYKEGAELGHENATNEMALCYIHGRGVEKNAQLGLKYLLINSLRENTDALYHLGIINTQGTIVSKDDQHAAKLFKRAADDGHAEAMTELGLLYSHGKGVTKDTSKAVALFTAATQGGSVAGMRQLGLSYLYGNGISKDKKQALHYLQKAAQSGDKTAAKELKKLTSPP